MLAVRRTPASGLPSPRRPQAGDQTTRRAVARVGHRGATVNTDDHPVVAYAAPLATYAPAEAPRDRLLALIARSTLTTDELLPARAGIDPPWRERLAPTPKRATASSAWGAM